MIKIRLLVISTAIALSLSACSSFTQDVSEGISGGWFSSDEEEVTEGDASIPGENDAFPKLGEVPERPETPAIAEEYEKLQSGLVADNQNAHYTDQVIRSQQIPSEEKAKPVSAPVAMATPVPAPSSPPVATTINQTSEGPTLKTPEASSVKISTPKIAEKPKPAPIPEPIEPQVPSVPAVEEQIKLVKPSSTEVGAPVDVAQVQSSQEAVAALSANRAEEQANSGTHIATLYYSVGNAVLSNNDKAILAQVTDLYGKNAYSGLVIIGHASIPVSPAVKNPALINYKVSLDRAVNVVSTLNALGIPKDLIVMDARGANQPIRTGNSAADHAYNRRAEIYFLK